MDTLKKSSTLLLLSFFILPGVAGASGQDSINELIKNGGNVNLSGTYVLTGPIMLSSDLKLNGQNLTTITIPNNADWSVWVPLMKGEGLHNVTIEGIEFNANADGNDDTLHGRGYYNCIHLIDCINVNVRNCIFHDGKGDGLRAKYCKNVKFYNNIAYKLGHDCFYAIDSEGILAWNNDLTTRTNSGLRLWNSKNAKLFCNRINSQLDSLGGNPGIQIEDSKGTMDDVRVFANTIYKTWGPGIWLISYDTGSNNYQNITIDHNRILQAGVSYNIGYTAGITINGVQGTNISNNVFDDCNNAGVLVLDGGQNTKIENNIVTNTHEHPAVSQSGTGYGIVNRRNAEIYILNNCFFNNVNGNIFRAESSGDDLQDPTLHDTFSGWKWDGSLWLCDFVITVENYTIDNSTFENEAFEDFANYTGANDTDLHEIIFSPVNNTCPSKDLTKNIIGCSIPKVRCPSIYDVPLIASITGCSNKMKNTPCTAVQQSSASGTSTSACEGSEVKLKIVDNSQSEKDSGSNSEDSTPAGSGGSSGQGEMVTPTPTPILPLPGFTTERVSGSGSAPFVVNFHSTAQNAIITRWDFGDTVDNEATGTDVSHTFSVTGTYTVTQTVTNPNGTATASIQINVSSVLTPTVADFIATPVSGSAPLRVSFPDKSQYTSMPGSTVMYDFGGFEGTSSERNPSHIYNEPGNYYVTQTVTNPDSPAGGSTKQIVITVNEGPVTLAANFNANRVSGTAPVSVTFTDESTGATTYAWDFGDGVGTSIEQNPSYIFTKAGSYNVVLTVSDGKGHSASKHVPITVTEASPVTPAQLIADFDADSTSGVDSLNVRFTDKSIGAVTWQWDFGDNSPIVTTRNAEHTFGAGNWNVNLKVSDGTNFASKTMTINVAEKQVTLVADFTADVTSGLAPLAIRFTDASKGGATAWSWDFGDGNKAVEMNPRHTFTTPGDYDVVLTVSDVNGHSASKHMSITVTQAPPVTPAQLIADFDADSTSGVDSLNVRFTDKSIGAVTWQWDFGDNSPIVTTRNAEHTFGAGNWKINLKVSDGTNFATKTMIITVAEKPAAPTADFTADRTAGESPLTVQFSDRSQNAVSYEWAFGDGEISTDTSPSHTYTAEGDYIVTLTVTGSSGEKSTSQTIIKVSKPQSSNEVIDDRNAFLTGNATPLNSP